MGQGIEVRPIGLDPLSITLQRHDCSERVLAIRCGAIETRGNEASLDIQPRLRPYPLRMRCVIKAYEFPLRLQPNRRSA